jgi:tRNA U34 5-methylaminomethyl-2-thiouridine-forming methyltransferase MnmC
MQKPPPAASETRVVRSDDGSFTAYSSLFDEHYHSTKDGALNESLSKHVIPAFTALPGRSELVILDICFGLGFNTLATLHYLREHAPETRVRIFSPEFDGDLVRSLENFPYPDVFAPLRDVMTSLSREGHYQDDGVEITLYIGDARNYLRECTERFDVVYQDAFSPVANPMLWTREYFADIAAHLKEEGVVTTYSTALKTRLALHENGLRVYLNRGDGYRNATVASRADLSQWFEPVDMAHKKACNPDAVPLCDRDSADA